MYNLIEYSDNYSKTSWVLSQYYRDELFLDDNDAIVDFLADKNNSASFKSKKKKKQVKQLMMVKKMLK